VTTLYEPFADRAAPDQLIQARELILRVLRPYFNHWNVEHRMALRLKKAENFT
jgi:hypothetical protein